jgi:type II secretory pathway pseudopilin PulG
MVIYGHLSEGNSLKTAAFPTDSDLSPTGPTNQLMTDRDVMRSRSLRQLKATFRSRLNDDGGFGLIEAVVALTIIFGLVLALMSTLDASSRILVSTRQQSAANALATELIERAQALEYQNMGLAASVNGATCPGDIGCYTGDFAGRLLQVAPGYDFDGEPIVFATGDTFRPFLDFHAVLDRDGTTSIDTSSSPRLTTTLTEPRTTVVSPLLSAGQPLQASSRRQFRPH